MNVLLVLSGWIDRINARVGRSLIWLILLTVVISAINAITRKFFNLSSNAYLEVQWYLFAAVFLLGAGYTLLENAHVRIDVLAQRLSPQLRNWIDIVGITFFLLPLCYFIIVFSWPVVMQSIISGERSASAGGLVRWPVFVLVPLGFALLGLQSFSELIKRVAFLLGKGPDSLVSKEADIDAPVAVQVSELSGQGGNKA